MKSKNKLFFRTLITAFLAIIIGALLKINGSSNADIVLATGIILKIIAISGIIIFNFSKIRTLIR
jgi:hypothetical protein